MAIKWSINQLDYEISKDDKSNVVTSVHWNVNDSKEVTKDGKKVRTNINNRIQDLEDQGYVAIENEDLVDIYRSFEFGRLEDHYNENAFALSNIDSKLNSQVVISSTTPASLEPQMQYISLGELEDYATDIVMGFGRDSKVRIFSDNDTIDVDDENSIDASKLYADDKEILELVNLVNLICVKLKLL